MRIDVYLGNRRFTTGQLVVKMEAIVDGRSAIEICVAGRQTNDR